jgi:hypothetical protein
MAWEQLLAFRREAVPVAERERQQSPSACPNDGEPLREGPDRLPFCPYDGWRPSKF